MSDKCVKCGEHEYYHYPKKRIFKSKKDFLCSRCTFISCHTPRHKGEHIPRDLATEINDLEKLLLASN